MSLFSLSASLMIWPLLLALSLAWRPMRQYGIRLLPWALVPGVMLWLAVTLGVVEMNASVYWAHLLLGSRLAMDDMRYIWLSLNLLVWGAAALHSRWVGDKQAWRFALFFLLSLAGSFGLVLAADAVTFYLAFSLMSLAAWGLVIHDMNDFAKRAAGWYISLAVLGELWLFVGILMRSAELGTTDLSVWAYSMSSDWGLWLIWLGLAVKVGVPVLHVWLPLAHPAAPVSASAVLSGVMIKAGVIGWWVLLPSLSLQDSLIVQWMPWLGVITMVYGAFFGLMQTDPKAVLAYSSISQMGWLIWGLGWVWQSTEPGLLAWWLAAFALHHALIKGALFLGVGWVKYSAVNARWMPWVWGALLLLALLLAGLPFGSGAWLKYQMKIEASQMVYQVPAFMLLIGSVATGLLMIHFLRRLARVEPQAKSLERSALVSWFALVLVALCWPYWVAEVQWTAAQVWSSLEPIALALVLAIAWRIRINKQLDCPPGDLVEAWRWLQPGLVQVLAWHQAWWLKQKQHIKYRRLKTQQSQRRLLKRTQCWEGRFLDWSNFMSLLVVGLLAVMLFALV